MVSDHYLNMRLAFKFFESANMQRWNDHMRPVEFTEMDKQAHKAVIAWVLARFEEMEKGTRIDWTRVIEGGVFEFLHRIILTDIKPPVFHQMQRERRSELNEYVYSELMREVPDINPEFMARFREYHDKEDTSVERRILNAAHYLATNWEFKIIYAANPTMYGIESTRESIEMQIEDHYDLIGVQRLLLKKKSFGFIEFCGQLRFQTRWARSPRIPRTSVLGHMLMVAVMSYMFSMDMGACPRRLANNFYAALFHDLPEVLTKDIISPVKKNVTGLDELIVDYEKREMDEKLFPLLPSRWQSDFRYLLEDQWSNRVMVDGRREIMDEVPDRMNIESMSPIDGSMLKVCDNVCAYMEASTSIHYGIRPRTLVQGRDDIRGMYRDVRVRGHDISALLEEFESMADDTNLL